MTSTWRSSYTARPRAVHIAVAGLVLAVLTGCSASVDDEPLTLDTVEEVATTLPLVAPALPIAPTPTPFDVPAPAPTAQPTTTPIPNPDPPAVPTPTPSPASTETPTAEPTAVAAAPTAAAVPTNTPTPLPEDTPTAPATPVAEAPAPAPEAVNVGAVPLGLAGPVALQLPVTRVELIGFHEAGHPGSQAINAALVGVPTVTMDSRSRGTPPRSAADIVVPPDEPVLAPATGTIIAANSYQLYCVHQDRLVYIEPDGLPGWQVRVFHVVGEAPAVGSRVTAGETVIASSARVLPFESQVDELTGEPSWPHVHVEVVDTSVPDTRPPGPGCD